MILIVSLLVAAGAAGIGYWWYTHRQTKTSNLSSTATSISAKCSWLSTTASESSKSWSRKATRSKRRAAGSIGLRRIEPQVAQAEAQVAAQREVHSRLQSGSRPEEIAQARANVASAKADTANARRQYERMKKLSAVRLKDQTEVRAVSQEDS